MDHTFVNLHLYFVIPAIHSHLSEYPKPYTLSSIIFRQSFSSFSCVPGACSACPHINGSPKASCMNLATGLKLHELDTSVSTRHAGNENPMMLVYRGSPFLEDCPK